MPQFWTIKHEPSAGARIPPESWCDDHEPGERDYLARHGLADSGDVWVRATDAGEDGPPDCQEPGCHRSSARRWAKGDEHVPTDP